MKIIKNNIRRPVLKMTKPGVTNHQNKRDNRYRDSYHSERHQYQTHAVFGKDMPEYGLDCRENN